MEGRVKLHERIDEALSYQEMKEVQQEFFNTLTQVFTTEYLGKVKFDFIKNIRFVEKDFKDPSKTAYTEGRTIYVNEPIFDRLTKKERAKYLLHEFIHIMQNTKNFLIFRTFKEVYEVGVKLYRVLRKHLTGDLGSFLTGRKQKLSSPKYEVISYLMNGDIDWTQLSEKGKVEFVKVLSQSGIFNLKTRFWADRLS